jgi:prepilin-type N-terminal cleavage/methylation domain-containing protein
VLLAAGFTLVELLVVIGIIALLMGILLPTLSRAREAGSRTKCASNLHNLGLACHSFANDHKGWFPAAYGMPDPKFPYRFPIVVGNDPALDDTNFAQWQAYGTSYSCFTSYGMTDGVWQCPSNDRVRYLDPSNGLAPEWGPAVVWTGYMYVGGLVYIPGVKSNIGSSTANWINEEAAVPAVRSNQNDQVDKILAADIVFYSGGAGYKWDTIGRRYFINHPNSGNPFRPDFQNILYGDGHVEPKTFSDYGLALNASNYTFRHANNGVGGFMYWGQVPPIPPVPQPPTPPNPNPAPPSPPKPPPITPQPIPLTESRSF